MATEENNIGELLGKDMAELTTEEQDKLLKATLYKEWWRLTS